MEPIARYREKRFDGRREFQLFEDRVLVTSKEYMGGESTVPVLLNTLVPVLSRYRARDAQFQVGLVTSVVVFGLLSSGTLDLFSHVGGLSACIGIGCALMSIVTARKIEWVSLNSEAGFLSLSIGKVGPDKASFDAFVECLLAQVIEAKKSVAEELK